jgi:hypothetical protein
MKSAKKIVPISQKIMNSDGAYDAAFESDITAPLPKMSGTLQGFTLVFFIISFISLAIIACILVSQLSNNTNHTITAIVIFIVLMIVSMSLIIRYG